MPEPSLHERALELAVVALDFELDATERAWLDGHLAGCAACRRRSGAFAADARAIARLPQTSAPERVRARVLGGQGRDAAPALGRRPWLATVAALGVVAAVGGALLARPMTPPAGPGGSVAASTAPATSGSASQLVPSVTASPPQASNGASPASSGQAVTDPLVWQAVAVPSGAPREIRALSAGAGIAVTTLIGSEGEPRLWRWREGEAWTDAELPSGAFGGTAPWLVEPFGARLVALGWTDRTRSPTERRIWVSPDGLAWGPDLEASGRLGPITYGLLATSDALALVAGRGENGDTLVWRSDDGDTWEQLHVGASVGDAELTGLTVAADAFLAWGELGGEPRAWRTVDGAQWDPIVTPPGLAQLDGLSRAGGGYLAWGRTSIGSSAPDSLQWSADGEAWAAVASPPDVSADDGLAWIEHDASGLVAQWRRPDGSAVFGRSPDGRTWTEVDSEGIPAGVQLDRVARVGDRLVALGRDAEDRVVSFTTAP